MTSSQPAADLGLERVGPARLPTRHGEFQLIGFRDARDGKDHAALVRGDVAGRRDVPVRIHSECLTGDAFGSLRCDCRQQLEAALDDIGRRPRGVVLYLRQEGRGIGLANKVRAYQLQDRGYDTNAANEALGFQPDEREYGVAAAILTSLGVASVRLMSNNPEKVRGLASHGIPVASRIPLVAAPNRHNAFYLETKRRSGHLLPPVSGALVSLPAGA